MWTRIDWNPDPRSRSGAVVGGPAFVPTLLLALVMLLVPLAVAPTALAQDAPPAAPAEEGAAGEGAVGDPAADRTDGPEGDLSADEVALRTSLLERYRTLPAREGVLLEPRQEMVGIRAIQVSPGEVAVNGELVSPTILRSWLGEEAEPLLALAALEAERLATLLPTEEGLAPEEGLPPEEGEAGDEAGGDDGPEEGGADELEELDELDTPPAPPAPPEPPEEPRVRLGQQFNMGNDIRIDEDELATEAVAVGGSIQVDGVVRRDVVAIAGNVRVDGEVRGEIVAVFGSVILGPDAVVGGNVTAVGGEVRRAPGARVGGDVSEISGPYIRIGHGEWGDRHGRDAGFMEGWRIRDVYWNLVGMVLLGLLVCLALLVARSPVERVDDRIRNPLDFVLAGVVGLASALVVIPLLIVLVLVLVITIVGCVLLPLVPLVVLALVVVALLGYAGVCLRLGRLLEGRFGWRLGSPYVVVLVGLALIQVWHLVGDGLNVFGGPVRVFALMFISIGWLVEVVALLVGLGAILMNLLDRSGPAPTGAAAGAPALPPAPGPSPAAPPAGGGAPPAPPASPPTAAGGPPAETAESAPPSAPAPAPPAAGAEGEGPPDGEPRS